MDAVGFLLAGYSGDFEPMEITAPNGSPITCDDQGALCMDIDLIQYVQVNTAGRYGDWHVVVDAGPSGAATFSFTSFAASPITVEGQLNHTVVTAAQHFTVNMTGEVDGSILDARFRRFNGESFGNNFHFYDDGLHNDHLAGDGVFGSENFTPPGSGSAYLILQGLYGGTPFTRYDPKPYLFSPLDLLSLGEQANYGGATQAEFEIANLDVYDHCYWLTYSAPEGWWVDFAGQQWVCLYAGETKTKTYPVYLTAGSTNNLPSGTSGVLTLTAIEYEKGAIHDTASVRITRQREPYSIYIVNEGDYLRPNGDTAVLTFMIWDAQDYRVADGTAVHLTATGGSIIPALGISENGIVTATFTSGTNVGTANIYAQTDNFVTASTSIEIKHPLPTNIKLRLSTNTLPADGVSTAQLTATVSDEWGSPVSNQLVNIGVEADGQMGTIEGGEVISGYTDASGQFSATYTSGTVAGFVGVRAELVVDRGGGPYVAHDDRGIIFLGVSLTRLPMIQR
jgi:hypothetical protein